MGLPGHRRTSSHKRRRASHFALKHTQLGKCQKCEKETQPHRACGFCGYYGGRQAITVRTALDKKQAVHEYKHTAK